MKTREEVTIDALKICRGAVARPVQEQWIIVKETAVDVGQNRPELGYTFLHNPRIFESSSAASNAMKEANLPPGFVYGKLSQFIPDLFSQPAPTAQPKQDATTFKGWYSTAGIKDSNREPYEIAFLAWQAASQTSAELVRYCPSCASIGEVKEGCRDCCPDGSDAKYVSTKFANQCRETFLKAIEQDAPVLAEPLNMDKLHALANEAFGETVDHDFHGKPITNYDVLLMGAYGPAVYRLVNLAVKRFHPPASPNTADQVDADTKRLDWLETMVVNVRVNLRHRSRDLFWSTPEDLDGDIGPSDIRAAIDRAKAIAQKGKP